MDEMRCLKMRREIKGSNRVGRRSLKNDDASSARSSSTTWAESLALRIDATSDFHEGCQTIVHRIVACVVAGASTFVAREHELGIELE